MKLTQGHDYVASISAKGMANSAIAMLLETAGFDTVQVFNEDDAEDPEKPAGNRDNLDGDFPPGLRNDPVADHWARGVWSKPSDDVPPPPGLLSIVDLDAGQPPAPPPTPKPKPGPGPTPKPGPGPVTKKPGPIVSPRALAIAALLIGVVGIGLGGWLIHRRLSRKKKRLNPAKKTKALAA